MDLDMASRFAGKRVLLLQGPVGPFFARLADTLRSSGATVSKINFNGGDWLFYPRRSLAYRGGIDRWPTEFEQLLDQKRIDVVMLFGDCRPIHVPVHEIALRRGVAIWAFEEGYVRPDFVTFEPYGVNNRSLLPRDPQFYLQSPEIRVTPEREVGNTFWAAVTWASLYYFAAFLLKPWFRKYQHHRPLCVLEALPWLISPLRKSKYKILQRGVERRLSGLLSKQYFLVPLQAHGDAQVLVHSCFRSVPGFIEAVVASFAKSARPVDYLVFKHHPMDRGYHDYSNLFAQLSRHYGLGNRLLYIHDQHLPTLLANARGVVVINSTVGISALHHGTPLKVLGDALYDIPGLTAQCAVDEFWQTPEQWVPNQTLYRRFRAYLISRTQLNGNFYRHGLFPRSTKRRRHRDVNDSAGLEPATEVGSIDAG